MKVSVVNESGKEVGASIELTIAEARYIEAMLLLNVDCPTSIDFPEEGKKVDVKAKEESLFNTTVQVGTILYKFSSYLKTYTPYSMFNGTSKNASFLAPLLGNPIISIIHKLMFSSAYKWNEKEIVIMLKGEKVPAMVENDEPSYDDDGDDYHEDYTEEPDEHEY